MDEVSTNSRCSNNWWQTMLPIIFCCSTKHNHKSNITFTNLLLRVLVSILISLSIANPTQAKETKVLFIKSGSAAVYNQIIQAAKSRLSQTCNNPKRNCPNHSMQIVSVGDSRKLRRIVRDKEWDLFITIGTKAAIQLTKFKLATPTLYSLIPSHSYQAIKKASISKTKSAIYIDQPLERQLLLIKSALPKKKRVGVLLGKHSGNIQRRLQNKIRNMGLTPVITKLKGDDIRSPLNSLYKKIDVLLAIPDPSVYNKKSVMTVLLSSYRHNVPVIGYSAAFARSGATASIYSSPADIGNQIGIEMVNFISSNNKKLSPAGFSDYFSVKTNRRVIRSLNLAIPSTSKLKTDIKKGR